MAPAASLGPSGAASIPLRSAGCISSPRLSPPSSLHLFNLPSFDLLSALLSLSRSPTSRSPAPSCSHVPAVPVTPSSSPCHGGVSSRCLPSGRTACRVSWGFRQLPCMLARQSGAWMWSSWFLSHHKRGRVRDRNQLLHVQVPNSTLAEETSLEGEGRLSPPDGCPFSAQTGQGCSGPVPGLSQCPPEAGFAPPACCIFSAYASFLPTLLAGLYGRTA